MEVNLSLPGHMDYIEALIVASVERERLDKLGGTPSPKQRTHRRKLAHANVEEINEGTEEEFVSVDVQSPEI